MKALKLTQIGNSSGIILPKEMLARLKVGRGDTLWAVEAPGGYVLTPYDPGAALQLEQAEAIMREERDVLKKLGE